MSALRPPSAARDGAIVVTGMGLTIPLGLTVAEAWARSLRGESSIGNGSRMHLSGCPAQAYASVADFDLSSTLRLPKNEKFMPPSARFLIRAAKEAVGQSGLDVAPVSGDRIGIYASCGQIGPELREFFAAFDLITGVDGEPDWAQLGGRASRLVDPYFPLRTLANSAVGLLAIEINAHGPSTNYAQYDTSGAFAIDEACRDLRDGRCDLALVGAHEWLTTPSAYLTYHRAGLLSCAPPADAYKPFDRDADGLVLGEGAGVMILERAESARRRAAPELAEIGGVSTAMDISRQLWPGITGADGGASLKSTLASAIHQSTLGTAPDFIVASGIGLPSRDRAEGETLLDIFGPSVPITALKSQTGYLGAASVMVEMILGIQALRTGLVPPIARLTHPRPELGADFVGSARPLSSCNPAALFISTAWTGQCAAVWAKACGDSR